MGEDKTGGCMGEGSTGEVKRIQPREVSFEREEGGLSVPNLVYLHTYSSMLVLLMEGLGEPVHIGLEERSTVQRLLCTQYCDCMVYSYSETL